MIDLIQNVLIMALALLAVANTRVLYGVMKIIGNIQDREMKRLEQELKSLERDK